MLNRELVKRKLQAEVASPYVSYGKLRQVVNKLCSGSFPT
jgi:hypothetical protein